MLTLDKTSLELNLEQFNSAQFHYAWLRDNCHCFECRHPETHERVAVTCEIADDIAPISASIEANELLVRWNQAEHESRYSLNWLAEHNYSACAFEDDSAKGQTTLWGKELEGSIPTFNYHDLRTSPSVLLKWCEAVRDIGLTIVRDAPLNEGEIERFADFVAVVRETIYDRLHNVRATPGEYNAYNVASTTLELKPHTDMPNYNNPPGVQMFHFLVNETVGGESTAVDGFQIAQQLKDSDPAAFQTLANTPVSFRMFSDRGDISSCNPLLTLDAHGEIKVFRFSNQLAQTVNLPIDQMEEFYRAYRKLGALIERPENKVQFLLETGDMMVTNNLRVMHGRNSYDGATGDRHLQLSYMDFDDVLSRLRMLLKSGVQ
ncbi:MAG: gamma-butyrobetaine dioxygenase [Pseudoalteromonas tetraodonis]|jgi:gamma-butyrobetaine dioxygenase